MFPAYALVNNKDFNCSQRDNLLKIISVIYHQLGAPFFQPFLEYSWYAGGYIDSYSPFLTPKAKCFDPDITNHLCDVLLCTNRAFMLCARCDNRLCWEHVVGGTVGRVVMQHHLC